MSVADFREKVSSGNLTLEDVELFNRLILENKSMITTQNVKIGILGFIKVGRFGQARRFFEKCLQRVGKNSPRGQEIFMLDKPLKELEQQRRIKLSNKSTDLSRD